MPSISRVGLDKIRFFKEATVYGRNAANTPQLQEIKQKQQENKILIDNRLKQFQESNSQKSVRAYAEEEKKFRQKQILPLSNETNVLEREKEAIVDGINKKIDIKNRRVQVGVGAALGIATQVSLAYVSTIGSRTGNVIQQQRLQRGFGLAASISGVAGTAVVNPALGVLAGINLAVGFGIREFKTQVERERVSFDNTLKLNLLDNVSRNGNR